MFFAPRKRKFLSPPRNEDVLFFEEKYQKSSKEGSSPSFENRLAATRANILPRQSDHRLNRKYGSTPPVNTDFCLFRL